MGASYRIKHYYHSGFSIHSEDTLLIFDYWRGDNGELPPESQITEPFLRRFRRVIVFISHEPPDHMDPIVFSWREIKDLDITYLVSSDMPVGTRGKRMAPRDTLTLADDLTVTAYDSTDLGVSFLVDFRGTRFFHAGDLNFWHWRDESTMQEIDEAEQEFQAAVRPLCDQAIDVAFFPVDPRLGTMFEAGANYFILSVKPRLLIPMHYFRRSDIAVDYARNASGRTTEVLAMPDIGEEIQLDVDESGYLNISFPPPGEEGSLSTQDNPFLESDLPLEDLDSDLPPINFDEEPPPLPPEGDSPQEPESFPPPQT